MNVSREKIQIKGSSESLVLELKLGFDYEYSKLCDI